MRERRFPKLSRSRGLACAIFTTTALLLAGCTGATSGESPGETPEVSPGASPGTSSEATPGGQESEAGTGDAIALGNIYFVTSMVVTQGATTVPLEQDGTGLWNVAGLLSDDTIPTQFVDSLSRLNGTGAEIPEEAAAFLSVEADGITLEFFSHGGDTYVLHGAEGYRINRVSPFLAKFDIEVLVTPSRLEVGGTDVTAILVSQDGIPTLDISEESTMSAAERFPLVSGKFLHNHFHREYSIRAGTAKELETTSASLKLFSEATDVQPVGAAYLRSVQVVTGAKTTDFELWGSAEDYFVRTASGNFFLLAANQAELYLQEPFEVIDRFVVLIPVNDLDSFSLQTPDASFVGSVIDAAAERPDFTLNDQEVDQSALRRAMQYVGNIHAVREYQDEAVAGVPWATLEYVFDSDGSSATRTVKFFELQSGSHELAAFEDGQADFVVTKDMMELATAQLGTL